MDINICGNASWTFALMSCFVSPPGNGSMQTYSSNNAAVSGPRDPSFSGPGRANGRPPGNGPPPVTMGGPPAPPKPSVTISNGRDPRRASKRWGTTEICCAHNAFPPLSSPPLPCLAHPKFLRFQARPTSNPLKMHHVTAILKRLVHLVLSGLVPDSFH